MAKTIWPKASSARVAKSLEAHAVIALALGGLIYILAVTGTLSVFNHELQRWEQPTAPEMTTISPEAAALAAQTVFESEDTPTTHLYINFPQPDLPRTVITTDTQAFFANSDGTVGPREHFPWTEFLLDLHYYLHLPHILGLTVVGALGAFLIAMSISGFMAHPRIFRDAFTFRRGVGRVPLTDLHNRLSVWTAPFHISNALTGAVLGLASVLAFAIASQSFSGDITKVFGPVFGAEPAPVEGAAPLAEIAGPIAYMNSNYPDLLPTYFILHDPGTAGQHSTIIAEHSDRLIFGEYYNFDADGFYEGNTGISDGTVGQQIIGSVYNVHFGNWGGAPVKLAYLVFGLALSVIIASGMRIYFVRRREKGRPAPRLEAGWEAVVWGTPAMLALTFLSAIAFGIEGAGLVAMFWLGLTLSVIGALWSARAGSVAFILKVGTAAAVGTSVAAHALFHSAALATPPVMPVTLALLIVAVAIAASNSRKRANDHLA
ncbi:MAG: PepSY-associated TM helix domain-containing protein [Pseudomonadota bacterium]